MSTVWAAEDLDLESPPEVKLLDPDYAREDRAVMRFRQEAQRAAKVRNPHVTTVFNATRAGGLTSPITRAKFAHDGFTKAPSR